VRWFGRTRGDLVFTGGAEAQPLFSPAAASEVTQARPAEPVRAAARADSEPAPRLEGDVAAPRRPVEADPQLRAATLRNLEGLRQIPALQSLVQGVTRTMCREGVSIDEIVESLQKDSSLCVRLLTMANSVSVASVERVEDLPTAVHLLGVARVRRLAQAAFTLHDAQRMAEGVDWRHLWIHALATASIAEELERRIRPSGSSQVYMAALLHDVGKIVLSTVAADAYREVIAASWNGQGRLEDLERAKLGVCHREAGAAFARGNKLSSVVVDVIAHHDDPAKAEMHRIEVALVSAANFISKARGLGFSGARLDDTDGELEDLAAWRVIEEETGYAPDVARLTGEMVEFFVTLRDDVRGMREGSA
jgi:putative nucleotidyltransferase with HDIG domain